jgi:uncharacterized membrane protein HdeD (DUF308 family)
MGRSSITIFGAILVLAGLIAFAIPVFTTQQTEDVVRLGDLKVQATQQTSHEIPPLVSGGALVLGVVLIGAGVWRGR